MSDLGITSEASLQKRHAQVRDYLPRVWEITQEIVAGNQGIMD